MNIIQIGCNSKKDYVFDFVKEKGDQVQKLIIVDALPDCIIPAKEQYFFLGEKLTVVNTAIGVMNGLIDFFHPENDSQSIHSSFDLNHLFQLGHQRVKKITLPCLNINNFIESLKLEKIDYFFIDVEGMDVIVLLEMDFDKYSPTNLRFEHHHSEGVSKTGGENLSSLTDKLKKFNYSVSVIDQYDTVATKN